MKWFLIPVLSVLALAMNACEKHPVSNLPPEHASAFGEHAWKPGDAAHGGHGAHGAAKDAKDAHAAPVHAEGAAAHATPAAEGKTGEAPSMFPPKK